jgi:hypothetical protein
VEPKLLLVFFLLSLSFSAEKGKGNQAEKKEQELP